MNFDDTPEEAAFRAEARAWIDANAPKELLGKLQPTSVLEFDRATPQSLAAARAWQKRKFDAGYACLTWPKRYGGREATPIQAVIWEQEEGPFAALEGPYIICHTMCGGTMMAFADEAFKDHYLPRMAAGELICCQLFSEPAGGSDLAALRTRAERAGNGDWIVNGQKIWTSGANFADMGLLLARTDPEAPKHKGLTMFFLDMKTPGVEVRPIKQADGEFGFNEVFFSDVRIPDDHRIGPVNGGWRVSMATLMNERTVGYSGMATGVPELFDLCARLETGGSQAIEDRAVRAKLAAFAALDSGLKYTGLRAISALSAGKTPGPENSIGKLMASIICHDVALYALDLQAQAGALMTPAHFQDVALRAPSGRIAGGTDQVMRTIIAERVLGLPADMRADKDLPFHQIPTS